MNAVQPGSRAQSIPGQLDTFPGAMVWRDLIVTAGVVAPTAFLRHCDLVTQIDEALAELAALLRRSGGSLETVLRVDAFLASASGVSAWNEGFVAAWPVERPARTTLVTGFVAPTIEFEVSAVAYRTDAARTSS